MSRSKHAKILTADSAAALAVEALAAVRACLALTRNVPGDSPKTQQLDQPYKSGGARELRAALAHAIGALRNACVGAASSTAELLGGEDPTGFAEEVRALADAHEKELEQAMVEEEPTSVPKAGEGSTVAARGSGSDGVQEESGGSSVGLEFWSRQSNLWSGVFAEQQTGLLQMVRAQEAELRQGKRRISSLEQELSALNDKRAEVAAVAEGSRERGRSLGESEASEWRQRLERMQLEYERRLAVLRERESVVAAAELRVESRAGELGAERDRLKAGAVALSAEADVLR